MHLVGVVVVLLSFAFVAAAVVVAVGFVDRLERRHSERGERARALAVNPVPSRRHRTRVRQD